MPITRSGEHLECLDCFFRPKSVAVIGASHVQGKFGQIIFENFIREGFTGKVYPVNPNTEPIMSREVYASVEKLPEKVDLAVVVTPAGTVPKILAECANAGIKSIIIISSGFSEIGRTGKELEDKCKKIIEKHRLCVIGPNCLGVYDSSSKVDTLFLSRSRLGRPKEGNIALISQSGAVGSAMLDWLSEQGTGISKFVSYGNAAGVNESDLLEYLANDENTKVIVSYIEGIKSDGKEFIEIAKKVTKKKPIIILKAGKTKKGTEAVASHTGSLAGSAKIYSAAFKQSGIIEAESWTELFDLAQAFASQPLPNDNKLLIVTDGGGFGVLATDESERRGLELKEPSKRMKANLKKKMPNYVSLHNPIDLTGDATAERYEIALEEGLKEFDGVVVITLFQVPTLDDKVVSIISNLSKKYKKPVLCCAAGGDYTNKAVKKMEESGIPTYLTPESAVRAFDAMLKYSKNLLT